MARSTPRPDEEQQPLTDEEHEQARERIREAFDEAWEWIYQDDKERLYEERPHLREDNP